MTMLWTYSFVFTFVCLLIKTLYEMACDRANCNAKNYVHTHYRLTWATLIFRLFVSIAPMINTLAAIAIAIYILVELAEMIYEILDRPIFY